MYKKIEPAEFYDIAAEVGFYGLEKGGLTGKKDYVRKYWEDIVIKSTIRGPIEKLLARKSDIRVIDLGCGSGEGFELLTHVPVSQPLSSGKQCFVSSPDQISYTGIDVSDSMVQQGRKNYENRNNVRFEQADLNRGFPLADEQPFDIYFSSYSSLSHLAPDKLQMLVEEIFNHANPGAIIVFDLFGKYSLEWPKYWNESRMMLPYNMAYLIPPESCNTGTIQWFDVCYWTPSMLFQLLETAAKKTGTGIQIVQCIDRSIFVGRHVETGLFGAPSFNYRYQVNRFFDRDYRGELEHLLIDLDWCAGLRETQPQVWARLQDYKEKWNCVINIVEALLHGNDSTVSHLIETTSQDISNELKFLTWLYRNAYRFPVVDFWASVMGPQIAVILRNIEMSLEPALGCGHGLLCVVEITESAKD
ncbi:MAG: class I SAM-dependent methyltransferase [Candidatus Methanoperedens sp.]|nr:class I SAM-dependent methyltransferase [Candidatus Methanoperedens sp.]